MKPMSLGSVETPSVVVEKPEAAGSGEGFGAALKDAVSKVDDLQVQADAQSHALAGGEGNLHETMLALEKADVAMRVAMKVRNKIIDAYNEVMRMSV